MGNKAESLTVGNVESMTNHIGNIEQVHHHHYGKQPRAKNIVAPLTEEDGGLSKKQKDYFTDTINKIVELGEITGEYRAKHAIVRSQVNDEGGVTTVTRYPAAKFMDGVKVLNRWIGPMLIHEKVVANPPEWWRDHLYKAIHSELSTKGTESAFREWLRITYSTDSITDLSDSELAEVYAKRKRKFSNPKVTENPRDFELRVVALAAYLDEAERAGRFDRMRIPLEYREILQELQASNRQLFSISESTFETFAKKAKKQLSFKLKQGVRSQARVKSG